MGRRATYLSLHQKASLNQERRVQYNQTSRFKKLRQLQNQRAYKRRKDMTLSDKLETSSLEPRPPIPEKLGQDASFPLPTSRLFLRAAEDSDALEGSDYGDNQLACWDHAPPYAVQGDIEKLEDAQHGRRHRIQRDYEDRRLEDYKTLPVDIFMAEVYNEILKGLREWEEADCALTGLRNSGRVFDIRMGEHWKQWQARRVMCLQRDFEALREGSDKFLCVYIDRWS